MSEADRERLAVMVKLKERTITQGEAGRTLGLSVRQTRRLLKSWKKDGDGVLLHGSRGKPSPRKIPVEVRAEAVEVLSADVYAGFGPTLAGEYLAEKHGIAVSKETVRQWMMAAGLWRGGNQKVVKVHVWRPRRSRRGDLVQWDTSTHDWLEGRGERIYLVSMIDDATSLLYARFVRSDSTEENMRTMWNYVEMNGRPLAVYTDKASLFQTAVKSGRGQQRGGRDGEEMPPTQIERALRELGVVWIGAHSPQAKGRVERSFETAQDRLVKGLRVAGAATLDQANEYLEKTFLGWWNKTLAVKPASGDDAHRKLEPGQRLAEILCHVETRLVRNDYTIQFEAKVYQIEAKSIAVGMRGATVRVEKRLDGTVAVRFRDGYVAVGKRGKSAPERPGRQAANSSGDGPKSRWMDGFFDKSGPSLGKAIGVANATS